MTAPTRPTLITLSVKKLFVRRLLILILAWGVSVPLHEDVLEPSSVLPPRQEILDLLVLNRRRHLLAVWAEEVSRQLPGALIRQAYGLLIALALPNVPDKWGEMLLLDVMLELALVSEHGRIVLAVRPAAQQWIHSPVNDVDVFPQPREILQLRLAAGPLA